MAVTASICHPVWHPLHMWLGLHVRGHAGDVAGGWRLGEGVAGEDVTVVALWVRKVDLEDRGVREVLVQQVALHCMVAG